MTRRLSIEPTRRDGEANLGRLKIDNLCLEKFRMLCSKSIEPIVQGLRQMDVGVGAKCCAG